MTEGATRVWQTAMSMQPDVFHIHDPELLPGALLASASGRRVVYDIHEEVHLDILEKEYIPRVLRRVLAYLYRSLETFACKRLAYVIAANSSTRDRLGAVARRLAYVPNYPIRGELLVVKEASRPRRGVAYIGAISTDRGVFEMMRACARARTKLLLAGKFASEQLRLECQAMPEWSFVEYMGVASREKVAEMLLEVGAGLVLLHPHPNNVACLSTKLLEYMSAGIPVIASDFPQYRKIIDEAGAGICVAPHDVEGIASAIEWLSDNPAAAGLMGERGRKAVEEHLNWERCSLKLVEVYETLASG